MSETKPRRKTIKNTGLQLLPIEPLNANQQKVLTYFNNNHLVLQGFPGTGKTFLALACALRAIEAGDYERIVLVRSAVTGRDMGFLPGTAEEKMAAYEEPYAAMSRDLYGRDDAYDILKQRGLIDFRSTSSNRGLTFKSAVVIVDEAQNLSDQELHTVITRLDNDSKLIISGDVQQDDLTNPRYKEVSGLKGITEILRRIPGIKFVDFTIDDIVRSDFVRDYIVARYNQHHGESLESLKSTFIINKRVIGGSIQSISAVHGPTPTLHD